MVSTLCGKKRSGNVLSLLPTQRIAMILSVHRLEVGVVTNRRIFVQRFKTVSDFFHRIIWTMDWSNLPFYTAMLVFCLSCLFPFTKVGNSKDAIIGLNAEKNGLSCEFAGSGK